MPKRKEGESDEDFKARQELYRKTDCRVPIAGFGMPNLGFGVSYKNGGGVIGNTMKTPVEKSGMKDGKYGPTGEYVYDPSTPGSWSLKGSDE